MDLKKFIIKKNNKTKLDVFEIELILAHVLKKTREYIIAHPEKILTKNQIKKINYLILKRKRGWPLAYLTGHKEFYGFNFQVNKNVLIPRPETELMIDEALKLISLGATIIDIGTGSGCLIITVAKLIKNLKPYLPVSESKNANYKFLAIDISASALKIASKNAERNNVNKKIKFIKGNLLSPLFDKKFLIRNGKLIILANLPYLTPEQIKNSPSIKKEPKLALVAGHDGLKYYRELFKQLKVFAVGCDVLCEIDPGQAAKIKQLIKYYFPRARLQIKKDLAGLNRLAIIKI